MGLTMMPQMNSIGIWLEDGLHEFAQGTEKLAGHILMLFPFGGLQRPNRDAGGGIASLF